MKLPDKFYKSLILFSLAILIAYLLSPLVLTPQTAAKPSLSDILVRGPSLNKETTFNPILIKWFLAFLAAFATVKGYKYWQTINPRRSSPMSDNPKDIPQDVKKYRETLNTISSLEAKSDPPNFINRRKKKKITRQKSIRLSGKQTRKIIASSRSLSEFKEN